MCIGKRQAPIITSFHMMRSLSIWCLYTPSRWRMSFNHSPLYLKNLGPAIEYFFPDSSFASAVKDMTSPLYLTLRSSTTSAVMSGVSQYSISSPTGIWHLLNEKLDARSVLSVSISWAVSSAALSSADTVARCSLSVQPWISAMASQG